MVVTAVSDPPPRHVTSGDPVHVLLVDDEERNLDALESILESPDLCLVRATSADEALRVLISIDVAAIVLDVRMPGVSGLELAQMIKRRRKTQHIPIIFLTAYYQEDEHVMQGYGAGAVDYLSKPCNPDILRSKVTVFVDLFRKSRDLAAEIEERRRAEQRIAELNDQLEQRVEELAASNGELEAFSYSVSHDLRAPLRQVAGFVSLLKKGAADRLDPATAEYLPLIHESVTRMGQLIDDLLTLSRVGRSELRRQPVSLKDVVELALESLRPVTRDRTIHWDIGILPDVIGDAAMLLTVMVNLLDNAIKFTRPRAEAHITVRATVEEREYVISVRDNGVGFDPRFTDQLFGVFQRLHSASEFDGTGIGLASVRRIVQRHGGRTWAEGRVDRGCTVHFSLPRGSVPPPTRDR